MRGPVLISYLERWRCTGAPMRVGCRHGTTWPAALDELVGLEAVRNLLRRHSREHRCRCLRALAWSESRRIARAKARLRQRARAA
jgi:hypothetical protein